MGHGIAGVYHQVHDDLFDLGGVCLDLTEVVANAGAHLDVVIDEAAQELFHVDDDSVQVEDFRLQDLLAAESEQLTNERGGAAGCALDAFNIGAQIERNSGATQGEIG